MALDACVKRILCGLSAGARQALNIALSAIVLQNNTLIATLQARLAILNIRLLPAEALRAAATAALQQAREAARMLPLALLADCADLGDLNVRLLLVVDREAAGLIQIIDDLNRLLAVQNELSALIAQLGQLNELIAQLQDTIAECAV